MSTARLILTVTEILTAKRLLYLNLKKQVKSPNPSEKCQRTYSLYFVTIMKVTIIFQSLLPENYFNI